MAQQWTSEQMAAAQRELEDSIPGYSEPAAFGLGVATRGPSGDILDVSYPHPNLDDRGYVAAALAQASGHPSGTGSVVLTAAQVDQFAATLDRAVVHLPGDHPNQDAAHAIARMLDAPAPRGGERVAVAAFIGALADDVHDSIDAYLRLHLLSWRLVKPNGVNVDGIFAKLTNVVWTNHGPFEVEGFELRRAELKADGLQVQVDGLDKFPRMTDYVIPSGVRIADASRVRLGAHLASGTTVMHEGYCNFNAGTLGVSMIEGRISQGVVIGNGSDVGGGASIIGTLSGGGSEVISVGENCLIGAEGGIGISLGDDCIVEAGCYITAGTLVTAPDGTVVKARDLSGHDGLLFRRHSQTGTVEALARTEGSSWQGLNESLHDN